MRVLLSPLAVKLAAAAVLVFAVYHAHRGLASVHFSSAAEARAFFLAQNLYCHNGATASSTLGSFFVSQRSLTMDDILPLSYRSQCGMTPEWSGVLWVCEIENRQIRTRILTSTISGKVRVWGNVCVAGDDALMDHIEHLYRTR